MDYQYFACDWIINDDDLFGNIVNMMDVAKELQCELRVTSVHIPQGYFANRFVISVPSQKALDEFVQRAGIRMGLVDWFHVSKEYYLENVAQIRGYAIPSLQRSPETMKSIEAWLGKARGNKLIREKIEAGRAIYVACDWIARVFPKQKWLLEVLKVLGTFEVGGEMRSGQIQQTVEGFYVQRFVLRVFSNQDLEKLIQHKGREFGLTDWFPVPEGEFLCGTPLDLFELDKHRLRLDELGRANGELRRKLDSQRPNNEQ